ncbi:TIGR04255 family protein [Acinetobacter baumannii 855125]|nr:TIGR04255 family protein [Acinetobacter baumannii OIFC109]KCX75082.1 TIGR04255 family protein [Acinetobacter baumannii 855125]
MIKNYTKLYKMCNLVCKIECSTYNNLGPIMHDFQKLSNHPLVLALAEFRFSAVLDIEKHIPSFQDKIRTIFPLTNELSSQEVQVNPNGIEVRQNKEWAFISKNKNSAVMLNNNRLVFLTSAYDRFEGFNQNCKHALDALASTISPALLMRIGLRYSDTILPTDEGQVISEFVDSSICTASYLSNFGTPVRHTTENIVKTEQGFMVIRSMSGVVNLRLWPDLNNLPIPIKHDSEPTDRILLDFDHFWEPADEAEAPTFNVNEILSQLDSMHETSRRAFWNITTEKGRKIWK